MNLVKKILKKRGFNKQQIYEFLNAKNLELSDYSNIFDIKKAAYVINNAIKDGKKIVIHGDYDVDGITATAILFDYLFFYRKANCLPVIPNRLDEGYGVSEKTLQRAIDFEAQLVITVDCGISDIDVIEKYAQNGLDFVVTDHHQMKLNLAGKAIYPKGKNIVVVHSMHEKSTFPNMISGAATSWMLVQALQDFTKHDEQTKNPLDLSNREVKVQNKSWKKNICMNYIDLVAFSTVCDVIPLIGENRKYVIQGLKNFHNTSNIGLQELMKTSELTGAVSTYHLGFVLGPRINASSRQADDAIEPLRLLTTKNKLQANKIAKILNEYNEERKNITNELFNSIVNDIELEKQFVVPKKDRGSIGKFAKLDHDIQYKNNSVPNQSNIPTTAKNTRNIFINEKVLVVLGKTIPEGIIGLIAGKLAEKYFLPTFVITYAQEKNVLKGSARSQNTQVSLKYILDESQKTKSVMLKYGGHDNAAGFSLLEKKYQEFVNVLNSKLDVYDTELFIRKLEFDLEIQDFSNLSIDDIQELSVLEPHGNGNPKPKFLIKNLYLLSYQVLKEKHLKLFLESKSGEDPVEGICFNFFDRNKEVPVIKEVYNILGELDVNEWNGKVTKQIIVREIVHVNNVTV